MNMKSIVFILGLFSLGLASCSDSTNLNAPEAVMDDQIVQQLVVAGCEEKAIKQLIKAIDASLEARNNSDDEEQEEREWRSVVLKYGLITTIGVVGILWLVQIYKKQQHNQSQNQQPLVGPQVPVSQENREIAPSMPNGATIVTEQPLPAVENVDRRDRQMDLVVRPRIDENLVLHVEFAGGDPLTPAQLERAQETLHELRRYSIQERAGAVRLRYPRTSFTFTSTIPFPIGENTALRHTLTPFYESREEPFLERRTVPENY